MQASAAQSAEKGVELLGPWSFRTRRWGRWEKKKRLASCKQLTAFFRERFAKSLAVFCGVSTSNFDPALVVFCCHKSSPNRNMPPEIALRNISELMKHLECIWTCKILLHKMRRHSQLRDARFALLEEAQILGRAEWSKVLPFYRHGLGLRIDYDNAYAGRRARHHQCACHFNLIPLNSLAVGQDEVWWI